MRTYRVAYFVSPEGKKILLTMPDDEQELDDFCRLQSFHDGWVIMGLDSEYYRELFHCLLRDMEEKYLPRFGRVRISSALFIFS